MNENEQLFQDSQISIFEASQSMEDTDEDPTFQPSGTLTYNYHVKMV